MQASELDLIYGPLRLQFLFATAFVYFLIYYKIINRIFSLICTAVENPYVGEGNQTLEQGIMGETKVNVGCNISHEE